ncbi:hypothetical protein [Streptomyces sp. NPDC058155]|uniref:hypothetical protein n=1 Tax=Streptomyces sp. NPDC058155 TaxID=3346359 RepID=UPI0036E16AD3
MSETIFSSFDPMVDKANRLLRDIEEANGWPKERRKRWCAPVLESLKRYVSEGEWDHLKSGLPNSLAAVLP